MYTRTGNKRQCDACALHAGYLRVHKHFGERNNYCFSAATLVGRTRLNVTLYLTCLSCDDNELGLLLLLLILILLLLLLLLLGILLLKWNKSIYSLYNYVIEDQVSIHGRDKDFIFCNTSRVTHDLCVISCFRHKVEENCALLGCYARSKGNFLLKFRDSLLVPSSGVNNH